MRQRPGVVLFLSHDASRTGAPIFLLRFLRWFREHGNVDFRILLGKSGELSSDFARVGAVDTFQPNSTVFYRALRRLDFHHGRLSSHQIRLRESLSEIDIRLIYVNSVASAEMLDFLSFLDCPVICHVHELGGAIDILGASTGVPVMDLLEKRVPRYIAVSSAVERNLVSRYGVQPNRVEVVHGFIPIPAPGQSNGNSREKIRRDLGIPAKAKIVCGCGSIESRKGTDIFLDVAGQAGKSEVLPIHFVWVGGDPESVNKMRRSVELSGMSSFVHFVGHQADVAEYFDAADLFLLTSREDPFPLVMLEAALCGKPIVCFEQSGGAPEFVGKDAGFIAKDVGEMSNGVIELLSSPSLCARLGAAARQKVLTHHDLEVGALRIASVIEDALALTCH